MSNTVGQHQGEWIKTAWANAASQTADVAELVDGLAEGWRDLLERIALVRWVKSLPAARFSRPHGQLTDALDVDTVVKAMRDTLARLAEGFAE